MAPAHVSTARLHSIAIAAMLTAVACDKAGPADPAPERPAPAASPSGRADAPPAAGAAAPAPTTDSVGSLQARATRAYGAKDFATCARLFLEAAAAAQPGSGALYNAACCLALAGDREGAMAALERAVDGGLADVAPLKTDPDLASLRADPRWKSLLSRAEAKDAASRAGENAELARLFREDQADRQGAPGTVDWAAVAPRDAARRKRVREIVEAGQLKVAADHYHAAMVFQHGEGTDYRQAHELALRAVELEPGHAKAKQLAASAMDRWLMSRGEPQRYGTQFVREKGGLWKLHEIDPEVTDEERARWGVPPLAETRRSIEAMNRR